MNSNRSTSVWDPKEVTGVDPPGKNDMGFQEFGGKEFSGFWSWLIDEKGMVP